MSYAKWRPFYLDLNVLKTDSARPGSNRNELRTTTATMTALIPKYFFYIFVGNNYQLIDVPLSIAHPDTKYFLLPRDQVGAKPTPYFYLCTRGRVH